MHRHSHMHLYEFTQPLIGFVGAGASYGVMKLGQLADALPQETRGWMEAGGTVGLIGFLIYAVFTLWKRVVDLTQRNEDLNKEIRGEWKDQVNKLVNVLEKFDPDGK